MDRSRADEIIRKVFYTNFGMMPLTSDEDWAFQVGRMVGTMQKTLEIELQKEVDKESKDGSNNN